MTSSPSRSKSAICNTNGMDRGSADISTIRLIGGSLCCCGHHPAGQLLAGIPIWRSVSAPHREALVHDHFCSRAELNDGGLVGLLLHRNVAVRADDLQGSDTLYDQWLSHTKSGPVSNAGGRLTFTKVARSGASHDFQRGTPAPVSFRSRCGRPAAGAIGTSGLRVQRSRRRLPP
jgi:hypothetical protein